MKMTHCFFGSLLLVIASLAQATDDELLATSVTDEPPEKTALEKGKELYEKECLTGCHGIELYIRENRYVKDYQGLKIQIQTCATNLGKPWFEEEIAYVSAYLNEYYKFETEETTKTEETTQ